MDIKLEQQVRGTRLLAGEDARKRREVLNALFQIAASFKFEEVLLPTIEPAEIYKDKAGPEILNQMYLLNDRRGRQLCLRPEGTATCQLLANSFWKSKKDIKICYEVRCFRYERPQAGRYREFTQFGVEVLNPRADPRDELLAMAEGMIKMVTPNYAIEKSVKRGLAYYLEDGFEILCPALGAQKQVLGGGRYKEGIGFAIGVDRLVLAAQIRDNPKLVLEPPPETE
jgi:histidyl-tRNA synthetase